MKTISIMVVGTSSVLRDGYLALFGAIPGLVVLSPAEDGPTAIAELAAERPDLVVLDSSVGVDDARAIVSAINQGSDPTQCLAICLTALQAREMQEGGVVATAVEGILPAELVAEVRRLAMNVQHQSEEGIDAIPNENATWQ